MFFLLKSNYNLSSVKHTLKVNHTYFKESAGILEFFLSPFPKVQISFQICLWRQKLHDIK